MFLRWLQFPIFIEKSKIRLLLHQHHEKKKKKENKIDDKVTIDTTPFPDTRNTDTPNASSQDAISTDSYLPYPWRNHNKYCIITPNTKNMIYNTDTSGAGANDDVDDNAGDSPNADDNDDVYYKLIQLSLCNCNQYF